MKVHFSKFKQISSLIPNTLFEKLYEGEGISSDVQTIEDSKDLHLKYFECLEVITCNDEFIRFSVFCDYICAIGVCSILQRYIELDWKNCIITLLNSELELPYFIEIIEECVKTAFDQRSTMFYLEHYGSFIDFEIVKSIHKYWIKFPLTSPFFNSIFLVHGLQTGLLPLLCYSYYEEPVISVEFLEKLNNLRKKYPTAVTTREIFNQSGCEIKQKYVVKYAKIIIIDQNSPEIPTLRLISPTLLCRNR